MSKKLILFFIALILLFSGCATVPTTYENITAYQLNGVTYYPLVIICNSRRIDLQYDSFTRTVSLHRDAHRVNLRVGDNMALVDGSIVRLSHPVKLYEGTVVVPSGFKEQVIDTLFKVTYTGTKSVPAALKIKKVVIDAGHGGVDPGAIGRTGVREKDVNLDVARRLSSILRASGLNVVMTRTSDKFIPLGNRVDIANSSGADIFVSIHSNANRVRSLKGFEVYYVANNVDDAKRGLSTARDMHTYSYCNCLVGSSSDLKSILWDMMYTSSRAESIELSRGICRSMRVNLDSKILGVKGARYEVLRGACMPAVLVEIGFLSNYDEERMLKNGLYRQKIAEGIADGIQDYARDAILMEVVRR